MSTTPVHNGGENATFTPADSMTTGEFLGRYRKELVNAGIPSDLADRLVLDAGCKVHDGQLRVGAPPAGGAA